MVRTIDDARRLRAALVPGSRLAVIGAGFIGQEVAATAAGIGVEVTIVEAAEAPLAAVLGASLGGWFARAAPPGGHHSAPRRASRACTARRRSPRSSSTTATRVPGIYAAGDASRTFDARIGTHVRTEHWEAAARQGAAAARAMLGLDPPPPAIPSFWSDQHGLRIHYLGHAHGADVITIDGEPDARDFAATYIRDGTPVAALLVGRPHAVAQTRGLLEQETRLAERNAA